MVEIVPMNFISYQKLVKMVKDVYYSMGLSYELALEMGFNWHFLCMKQNISCKALSAIIYSHFQGKKRSHKLLTFNDLCKKLNDGIKICILIKTTNLCELILAVVPLC